MSIDPRIADYIRQNRKRYTRDAVRQRLMEAGHAPEDIDATWAALDMPDPDQTAGEGYWGRFWLILVGINVAVFLLVGLLTGLLTNIGQGTGVLLVVLAIALGITALIAFGIVAATRPARLGRSTALSIGVVVPLIFALLAGGSCYALVGAIGPPPRQGSLELDVEGRAEISGAGSATCYIDQAGGGFSVFGQREGEPYVTVSVDTFPPGGGRPTGDVQGVSVSLAPVSETDPGQHFSNVGGTGDIDSEVRSEGLAGTVAFTDLPSDTMGEEMEGPKPEPISGIITWDCE